MGAGVEPHGIPHHLLALGAVEMLRIGWIDELELTARLFLCFLDRILDTANAPRLTHIGRYLFYNISH